MISDAEIVKNIFHTARNPSFVMIKMQKQKGHVDYGVFVIANTTSLGYGINPVNCVFDHDLMSRHLL